MEYIDDIKNTPIQILEGTVLKLEDIATIQNVRKKQSPYAVIMVKDVYLFL